MGRIIGEITGGLGGRLQMDKYMVRYTFSSNHKSSFGLTKKTLMNIVI